MKLTILGSAHAKHVDSCIHVQVERKEGTSYVPLHDGTFLLDAGALSIMQNYLPNSQLSNAKYILLTHGHGDHILGLPLLINHHRMNNSPLIYGAKENPETNSFGIISLADNILNSVNHVEDYPSIRVNEVGDESINSVLFEKKDSRFIRGESERVRASKNPDSSLNIIQNGNYLVKAVYGNVHSTSKDFVLGYSITERNYGHSLDPSEFGKVEIIPGVSRKVGKLQSQAYKRYGETLRDKKDVVGAIIELNQDASRKIEENGKSQYVVDASQLKVYLDALIFFYAQNKVSFLTDMPVRDKNDEEMFSSFAKDSDFLICGTPIFCGSHPHHITTEQAARIAEHSNSKKLIITHLNPQYADIAFHTTSNISKNKEAGLEKIVSGLKYHNIDFSIAREGQEEISRKPFTVLQ